jgi:L-rhamnonate dehydratase
MHKYPEYKVSRTSWGIGVLGSIFVKLTASDGTVGYATGFGGPPACWLIEEHYRRFIIGQDPRDTNKIWDQMFRASMFYGRKGESIHAMTLVMTCKVQWADSRSSPRCNLRSRLGNLGSNW